MSDLNDRLTQFCDYVQLITGLPVMKMKRSFVPQMKNSFAVVGYGSLSPVEHDRVDLIHQQEDNDFLVERVRGLYLVELLVQVYGKGALSRCSRLKMSLQSQSFSDWGSNNEIGFAGEANVADISGVLLDSNYEERAQLTATFYVTCPEDFDIDFFTKENITVSSNGDQFVTIVQRSQE